MKTIGKKQGFLENLQTKRKTITIGIMGATRGSGVTSMVVCMANYMAGVRKDKVAIYEANGNRSLEKLGEYLQHTGYFSYGKCDYYPKNSIEYSRLCNEGYDVIIIDFGSEYIKLREFMRCNHKIVMESSELWNYANCQNFWQVAEEIGGSDTWLRVINGDKKQVAKAKQGHGGYTIKRPFIDNPFVIDSVAIEFFETLF